MTTVEWFAFAMAMAFAAGGAVATLVITIRSDYWSNDS